MPGALYITINGELYIYIYKGKLVCVGVGVWVCVLVGVCDWVGSGYSMRVCVCVVCH